MASMFFSAQSKDKRLHYVSGANIHLANGTLVVNACREDVQIIKKDTVWAATVYYINGRSHNPLDTTNYSPAVDTIYHSYMNFLIDNNQVKPRLNTDEKRIAYAERKHFRTFCFKVDSAFEYCISLKTNQNFIIHNPISNAYISPMPPNHKNGWVRIFAPGGFWRGDTLELENNFFQMSPTIIKK